MDGWGLGNGTKSDAIQQAKTPFIDACYEKYPHSKLNACGEFVGLPDGQMGNSEVGHMNIGAGRVVYQDLVRINVEIKEKKIDRNEALLQAFQYVKANNKKLHFIGLVSDGGVHSLNTHLEYLCQLAHQYEIHQTFVHAFTDGRDTDPKSGLQFIQQLENCIEKLHGDVKIASIVGRYYAMDRDKRWERIKIAYDLLTQGIGNKYLSAVEAIENQYNKGITDEFIEACVITDHYGNALATIEKGDAVICFNFRTDRCREITLALTQQAFPEYGMIPLQLHYTTMTRYDNTFKNVQVMYEKDNLCNTLGEVLAQAGKTQIRIAETEKYPHVTFFFSGGREAEFEGEKRILVNSPKVATYDLQPEMSAHEVTHKICDAITQQPADFICLNFANPDMVGHTGVYDAIIKAVETVDACVQKVVETGLQQQYSFIIIADHGNADFAINEDGSPNTAHSLNLVPCILIDTDHSHINNGKLGDIAPTILKLMEIEVPKEMTGNSLV